MAETMLVAFGRFLRLLRERRGLSLDQVEALTSAYPEPVSKVYLSRIENGHSKIAFSRMIAICRAYEYPIDAASERLWLDLGVDRMEDPPETAGKGAKELLREGRSYIQRGFRWHAYACARDAIAVAKTTPVSESFRDHEEQFGICLMNTATASLELGRSRFALAEFQTIKKLQALSENHTPLLTDRLAAAFSAVGERAAAEELSEQALRLAATDPPNEFLGFLHGTRGFIASRAGDLAVAGRHYREANKVFRAANAPGESAKMLANLAQVYFNQKRVGAAKRALIAADRIASELDLRSLRARIGILIGEIQESEDRRTDAESTWRVALRAAEQVADDILVFKLKFFLFRSTLTSGRVAMANRYRKSLIRLLPWIPENIDELHEFKKMTTGLPGGVNPIALHVGNVAASPEETDVAPSH